MRRARRSPVEEEELGVGGRERRELRISEGTRIRDGERKTERTGG